MSLDRQRDRYLIISQKNDVPYVGDPMNLDVDWLKPGMDKYTIVGEKPEYCFSVIEADGLCDQPVLVVAEARREL